MNNSITGKNFNKIATILAQNNMKNAFTATITEKQDLLLSAGFTSIKLGKGLAMPKTLFTCFYPEKFESPVLHKFANKEELEELLKENKMVETKMNNFVVIPPGIVGSIASIGAEKPKLDPLVALLRDVKDMEYAGSRTRNRIWPKSLEEIIMFFVGLAKHKLSLLNLLPTSVKLDKANQGELKAYNKEINVLLEEIETEHIEESEDEDKSVIKKTSNTKSKKRAREEEQEINHSEEEEDEEQPPPTAMQPNANNLSLEKQEKIAMIELLTRLSNNTTTRETAKSRMKWENWMEAS